MLNPELAPAFSASVSSLGYVLVPLPVLARLADAAQSDAPLAHTVSDHLTKCIMIPISSMIREQYLNIEYLSDKSNSGIANQAGFVSVLAPFESKRDGESLTCEEILKGVIQF